MDLKRFMKFEDSNVEIAIITGNPHFELVSVGMALGYTKMAKGKAYPREERIEQILKNAGISGLSTVDNDILQRICCTILCLKPILQNVKNLKIG